MYTEGEQTVGALTARAVVSQPAVSKHFGVLKQAGQGAERIRHRGDGPQADRLGRWLARITNEYANAILPFDAEAAHIWGCLRVPYPENPLDKQNAATALLYELVMVIRNIEHHEHTGVRLMNPFT